MKKFIFCKNIRAGDEILINYNDFNKPELFKQSWYFSV